VHLCQNSPDPEFRRCIEVPVDAGIDHPVLDDVVEMRREQAVFIEVFTLSVMHGFPETWSNTGHLVKFEILVIRIVHFSSHCVHKSRPFNPGKFYKKRINRGMIYRLG